MDGQLVVSNLTKVYPKVRAVDDLSFTVQPGRVTGFLGPNGSGKTTTLRMMLNLVTPTAGTATIGGVRYADLPRPLDVVGAVLEASSAHKGRTGRNHLRVLCAAGGYPDRRADEVLDLVGLSPAGGRKFRGYSLGMRQRLGIAAAMIGDPKVLILDEPANGLDPEGIKWMREFLRAFASQGRTVFVSSHLLGEMQQLADDVIIIAAGRMVAQGTVSDIIASIAEPGAVRVRTPHVDQLAVELRNYAVTLDYPGENQLIVRGVDAATVGRAALAAKAELHELTTEAPDLEQAFLKLTRDKAAIR
ncbi:MAG: ABC transporter ATP-binding protein [Micromonosporaceae bacterium]|nr:ABC transporter ATP-binding protein [Micromonosporaceae bacterium]